MRCAAASPARVAFPRSAPGDSSSARKARRPSGRGPKRGRAPYKAPARLAADRKVEDSATTGGMHAFHDRFLYQRRSVMKILMVLTAHDQLGGTGQKTGFWL